MPKISFSASIVMGVKRYQIKFEPSLKPQDPTSPPIAELDGDEFKVLLDFTLNQLGWYNQRDEPLEIYIDSIPKVQKDLIRQRFNEYSGITRVKVDYPIP